MAKKNRDEFTEGTKLKIAKRAGFRCSYPRCLTVTVGSNSDGTDEISIGTAAHICAAAPGGPRHDRDMSREERRSPENGIWMCRNHGTAVDAKDSKFTVELLHTWKTEAQQRSWRDVLSNEASHSPVQVSPGGDPCARLRTAVAADLEVFRRSDKWPPTSIELTLEIEGLSERGTSSALATALTTLDDLVLVAQPGMGKTTTVFQIAEAVLANGRVSPIIIPLGEWSVDGASLLESVLRRPAFRQLSEDNLRSVAADSGVALLLDGWNELGGAARKRAVAQLERLQLELPELSLLISTREQAADVPVRGSRIDLLPLDESQQLNIARELRGDAGERLVDQAWRTAGVRELITVPLYLTALLALPEGSDFPTTKEEVLRLFVAAHKEDDSRAQALAEATDGFDQRFLEDLAATTTRAFGTALAEKDARKSIFDTDGALMSEGQITEKPQPNAVLEALVSHHVLTRVGDPPGYSFQHQQFQEWYASYVVQRLMLASTADGASRGALMMDVLNQPVWEEAILFAVERMARGSREHQESCRAAIVDAFAVDPMLAAEMIYRSTDAVWALIGETIQDLVGCWHTRGKADRAFGFMIRSGRPEFLDRVWPLITHEDDQVHLVALRAGGQFRTSLLGSEAGGRLAALPLKIRQSTLQEIVFNSGMDGLDLVAAVARAEPDSDVKATVVRAFAFRRADRHVAEILQTADDETFDLLAYEDSIGDVGDDAINAGLAAARDRQRKKGASPYGELYWLVYGPSDGDRSAELTAFIAEMEIGEDPKKGAVGLIYEAQKLFPSAVADGILRRVCEGRTLPPHLYYLTAGLRDALEDDTLVSIALRTSRGFDEGADTAASVLGPQSLGRMLEQMFADKKLLFDAKGIDDEAQRDRYYVIRNRIAYTQTSSLLAAIEARSPHADNREMADLAGLISQHQDGGKNRGEPAGAADLVTIAGLLENWGIRLLDSPNATRAQLASIAELSTCSPSASLIPLLNRLLDEELRRWRAFREQAHADQYRGGTATNEARTSWTLQYQRAFHAIGGPRTAELMGEYLSDEGFGQPAALVLAGQWRAANEPNDGNRWMSGPDFGRVAERRAARALDPMASSAQADAIFSTVELLLGGGPTESVKKHAVALGIVAAALPHGQRGHVIDELVAIADRYSRGRLLTSLVLGGEAIDLELVTRGIADVFEAAQKQAWTLTERHELGEWLRLLPFTNSPADTFDIVRALPEQHRRPEALEEMLNSFGCAPSGEVEDVLFQLATADPRLCTLGTWRGAVMGQGTLSAARRLVDLAAQGVFDGTGGRDHLSMPVRLADLMGEYAELRAHVYELIRSGPVSPGLVLLAEAVVEDPDEDGLLLLIQSEIGGELAGTLPRALQSVVTEEVPSEGWKDAFHVVPAPAADLRRRLFAMTRDGGPSDVAARYLNLIDEIRDDYGTSAFEPRHPDLGSGKAWPIMTSEPDAVEAG